MDEKARIKELEKALKKAQKQISSLETKLEQQKKTSRTDKKALRDELKKKDPRLMPFADKIEEISSLVFPDIEI